MRDQICFNITILEKMRKKKKEIQNLTVLPDVDFFDRKINEFRRFFKENWMIFETTKVHTFHLVTLKNLQNLNNLSVIERVFIYNKERGG